LKVVYKSGEALLGEYTQALGKGGVAVESAKVLPIGTRFVFEMHAKDLKAAVEVFGEVLTVTPSPSGKHLLNIRYEAPGDRSGLDLVLGRIFDAQRFEKVRKHPRIPLHLRAKEEGPSGAAMLIHDISRGGLRADVVLKALPRHVKLGETFLLELKLSIGTLQLHGEVVWLFTPPRDAAALVHPGFGVRFGKLRPESVERLEELLTLRGLPPPPWSARVSFGMQAISRMP
jgi:Tfp pilus assembly protein PilZ